MFCCKEKYRKKQLQKQTKVLNDPSVNTKWHFKGLTSWCAVGCVNILMSTEGYNLGSSYLIEMIFKYYYKYVQYISNKYAFEL